MYSVVRQENGWTVGVPSGSGGGGIWASGLPEAKPGPPSSLRLLPTVAVAQTSVVTPLVLNIFSCILTGQGLGFTHPDLLQELKVLGTHVAVVILLHPCSLPICCLHLLFSIPTLLCPIAL